MSFLIESFLGVVFAKLMPFIAPFLFLVSALLLSDRIIDLFYRIARK